jgi:hypothetical protein
LLKLLRRKFAEIISYAPLSQITCLWWLRLRLSRLRLSRLRLSRLRLSRLRLSRLRLSRLRLSRLRNGTIRLTPFRHWLLYREVLEKEPRLV